MFSAYFADLEKKLIKKYKGTAKPTAKKGPKGGFEFPELTEAIEGLIPEALSIAHASIIDPSGFSPEKPEAIIYKKLFRKMDEVFDGKIPSALVYSSVHAVHVLDRKNLIEQLVEAAHIKKCDRFAEEVENSPFIASFIVSFDSSYSVSELKNSVLEIYREQNVDPEYEVDIIAVLGSGILVKNWREKRSYVALETEMDTLKWFFVLMNEYLEVEKGTSVDLRSLVADQKSYKEY
jgi:hypothetical protein